MKNKFLLLIFLVFSFISYSYSQPYQSVFGKDSTQWNLIHVVSDAVGTIILKTTGETTIDSMKYKIINNKYYIREDSSNSMLYYYDMVLKKDILIMNLNLKLNDKFILPIAHYPAEITITVIKVDTIDNRKQITFNEPYVINFEPFKFIEGVGTTLGPVYPNIKGLTEVMDYSLLCHFKDDTLSYKDNNYKECIFYWQKINAINNNIKIFPSPAVNNFQIESSNTEKKQIKIIDISGNILLDIKTEEKIINISCDNFSSGIYIIQITENQSTYFSKIIIQK